MSIKKREITIIGAGLIGSALAWKLASQGHTVRVLDPEPPGFGGASYGNVGHIAAELVEPLPSPKLLLTFWKELVQFGGPLHMPMRHWFGLLPWSLRFAMAAFRRAENTRTLAPLVRTATTDFEQMLAAFGRADLLRQNGHYQIWYGAQAQLAANAEAAQMATLDIPTAPADASWLNAQAQRAGVDAIAGLHFPTCGHVLDPAEVGKACADAAKAHGAVFEPVGATKIERRGAGLVITHNAGQVDTEAAVVAAGVWSKPLLEPFGLKVPLQPAYGYHVELPGEPAQIDAPILYSDQRLLVTPMAGRLRASSFMEFSGLHSKIDPRKFARLDELLARVGYPKSDPTRRWRGPRPILPDYLPGLGQVPDQPIYYAIGHQHIGLTLAPMTAEVMSGLIDGLPPRVPLGAFDLQRFD